jgi:hypothetical protein
VIVALNRSNVKFVQAIVLLMPNVKAIFDAQNEIRALMYLAVNSVKHGYVTIGSTITVRQEIFT